VVHKAEKKSDHEVEVRAITYKTNDEEFNETILDYKGQPQISSMISKLCSYNRRTEFIIKVLNDFIRVPSCDSKYEEYLNAESKVNRKLPIADQRIHCCLHFIPPGHT
jgi:septin family protein